MARPRNPIPTQRRHVYFPSDIIATLRGEEVIEKGSRSKYIVALIRRDLDTRQIQTPQPINPSNPKGPSTMARPRAPMPTHRLHIYLPLDVIALLRVIFQDPLRGEEVIEKGSLSKYITNLIRKDLEERRKSSNPQTHKPSNPKEL